jgi:hypothetical protein
MNDEQAQKDMLRAQKARMLLESDVLNEALNAIESDIVQRWSVCEPADEKSRERLWQFYKTAQKFRKILTSYIETGQYAEAMLAAEEKRKTLMAKMMERMK